MEIRAINNDLKQFEVVYYLSNGARMTKVVDEDYARMLARAIAYGKKLRSAEIRTLIGDK